MRETVPQEHKPTNIDLKAKILRFVRPLMQNRVYTARRGLAKGMKRRGGLGFVPRLSEEPLEEKFLRRLNLRGKVVFDIGGYEGIFALFFADKIGPTGTVVIFEPNPVNQQRIEVNLALNSIRNYRHVRTALGKSAAMLELINDKILSGAGSLNQDIAVRMASRATSHRISVPVAVLDKLIETDNLPAPDFVKIDVKGLNSKFYRG